jgi:hypothetical protein
MRRHSYELSAAGRRSSTWRVKKILATVIVLSAMGSVTVSGTYGLMNSEQSNARTSVSTGTLTFGNTVETGTACYSYGGPSSNVNSACQAVYTSATENYPGTPLIAHVAILNNGSLGISNLAVYMPSCVAGNTPTAPTPGTANPCDPGGAQFYIQETTQAGAATTCWFPGASGACTFAADSLSTVAMNANSAASAISLGSGPAAGQTRYFVIGTQLPTNAGNSLQGRSATFALTWRART